MGADAMILVVVVVLIFSFKLALSLSSFTLIKRLFSSSSLSAIRVVSFTYEIVVSQLMFFPPIYFYLPCIPSWYFKILFSLFLFCLENCFSYCFSGRCAGDKIFLHLKMLLFFLYSRWMALFFQQLRNSVPLSFYLHRFKKYIYYHI